MSRVASSARRGQETQSRPQSGGSSSRSRRVSSICGVGMSARAGVDDASARSGAPAAASRSATAARPGIRGSRFGQDPRAARGMTTRASPASRRARSHPRIAFTAGGTSQRRRSWARVTGPRQLSSMVRHRQSGRPGPVCAVAFGSGARFDDMICAIFPADPVGGGGGETEPADATYPRDLSLVRSIVSSCGASRCSTPNAPSAVSPAVS